MEQQQKGTKIGLALGGGGARGLAHIPMLEVFDELGVKPAVISGTSIGSVIGALYAAGRSGGDIRAIVNEHFFSRNDSLKDLFYKKKLFKTIKLFDLAWKKSGFLRGDKVIRFLYDHMQADRFDELDIPFRAVAADYWTGEQVVLKDGPLLPAIKASMGLPGIFMPVEIDGRVLIDGGTVNPVPFDLLQDDCDVVIAIDVLGDRKPRKENTPNALEAIISTFDIFQSSIVTEKRAHRQPTHYLRPAIVDIDILSFDKADVVYEQAAEARDELKAILRDYVSPEAGGSA